MALLESEGFGLSTNRGDYPTYGALTFFAGDVSSIQTGGPLGDNYAHLQTYGTAGVGKMIHAPASNVFMGCRFRSSPSFSGSGTGRIITFNDAAGTEQFNLSLTSADVLTINRAGNVLATLAASGMAIWRYIEVGAVIDPTAGSVIVRANGTVILSVSGVNTQGASGNLIGQISWGLLDPVNSGGATADVAHIYICDASGPAPCNTFLGDVRVQTLLPTANDAVAFTPNGLGANWQNAAAVPPVPGTDYNADATVGDQDTFACAPLGAGLSTVFGVSVKAIANINTAGARSLQTVLKSVSATSLGTAAALGTGASQIRTMMQTDPATSAQWTAAGVNAAKPGYKISA